MLRDCSFTYIQKMLIQMVRVFSDLFLISNQHRIIPKVFPLLVQLIRKIQSIFAISMTLQIVHFLPALITFVVELNIYKK